MLLSSPLLPAFIDRFSPMLAEVLRSTLSSTLKDAAKSSHLRALKTAISPERRVQRYENLEYSVVEATEQPLILGDSAVLFRVHGQRSYKPFLDANDVLSAVILPLSSRKMLVGAPGRVGMVPPGLRQATARCSLEYFIAAERSDPNILLRDEIGEDAALLTKAEIEEMVTELLAK